MEARAKIYLWSVSFELWPPCEQFSICICVYTVNTQIPPANGNENKQAGHLPAVNLTGLHMPGQHGEQAQSGYSPTQAPFKPSQYLMFNKMNDFSCVVLSPELRVKSKAFYIYPCLESILLGESLRAGLLAQWVEHSASVWTAFTLSSPHLHPHPCLPAWVRPAGA